MYWRERESVCEYGERSRECVCVCVCDLISALILQLMLSPSLS